MKQNLLIAISSIGFPIVVTLYLLISIQRSIDCFTDQLSELTKELIASTA
ncbi:YvrJ family protein [Mitsuokella multacida]|nr:YvrJ family protein [Mitsuokella multacida]